MKNKIGCIAIGQCGANIGQCLQTTVGIDTIYINTSKEDLDVLNAKNKYHIDKGTGCAKDRKVAKKLLKDDIENILSFIQDNFGKTCSEKDIIFLTFSAGGGTGSGIAPTLAQMLRAVFKKTIVLVTAVPSEKEALQTFINTYECFVEIEKIEKIGATFVIDNNNNSTYTKKLNDKFAKLLVGLFNYHQYNSENGNIDEKEIKKMLETKGMSILAKAEKEKNIYEKLNKNELFISTENDSVCKYALFSGGNFNEKDFISKFGESLDTYKNSNKEFNFLMVSGLTLPLKKILDIKEKIMSKKDLLNKPKKENMLDSLGLFEEEEQEEEQSVDDALSFFLDNI